MQFRHHHSRQDVVRAPGHARCTVGARPPSAGQVHTLFHMAQSIGAGCPGRHVANGR